MDLALVKEKLIEISTYFYQERIQEGMAMFMDVVGMITQIRSSEHASIPCLTLWKIKIMYWRPIYFITRWQKGYSKDVEDTTKKSAFYYGNES